MLDFLRQRAGSWMVKALLGAIIVVFVFWGVGTFRTRQADILAKVNGQIITFTEFRALYAQRLEQLQRMFQGRLSEEMLRQLNLPQQVLEELIQRVLFEQTAKEMGISVTPDEVRLAISQIHAFQTNGRFDPRRYRLLLRELRLTPQEFEEQVKAELLAAKLRHLLTAPIRATENEVREHYEFQNEKLTLAYVKIPLKECEAEVQVSEEDLKRYFEAHKERYRTPLKIKLAYYLVPFEEVKKNLKVSEEEIKAYYEAHKEEYHQPEKRKLRHILITKKPGEDDEAFFKRAQAIRQKIKSPEDVARLAKEYSDDPHTKEKGGELGYLTQDEVFPGLAEAIFSAKKGEILGPLRSSLGYHIILVEDIKPESYRPLEEVKEEITKKLKEEKLKHVAWEEANKIYDQVILLGGLKAWAEKSGKKIEETPLFDPRHPPKGPAGSPEVIEAALKLEEGELGPPIETPEGIIIFKVEKRDEPHIPPFEEVKDRVKEDYVRDKARELCGKKAEELLAALKEAQDPESVLKEKGLKLEKTEPVARKDLFKTGLPLPVAQAARGLAVPGEWYGEPVFAGEAYYLLRLVAVTPADPKGFEAEKKKLAEELTLAKRQEAFNSWYRHLREKAEIKLYQELPKP
ncbi:MAG: hypothetical protein GXO17_03720 [Thermodesulfobacteria bacterium]|nr:hypothetical protein [Thermodesulfobacteriota bacterium]